ncbi:MAG: FAD-binding protein [Verrucomicrobiales bacterium]|nr:FAD-binding protein [Verrucomicrobiales bacterium]
MKHLIDELAALLGPDRVSVEESVLREHRADKWFAACIPDVVVFAQSTDDVSRTLTFAARHRIPVTARGGGVGYVGGCVALQGGIVLSLVRMNRILEISPADGVAVVQPGVITGDLQREVQRLGWFFPPDPASLNECTLGGNVATNAGGPRCVKYGVTRHYVLGLEVVLASGEVLRTGSRCHKNRTGFDLVGLFVGSEGMLGVVTEITFRLIPWPPCRRMISAGFASFEEAAAAVQAVFSGGFLPSVIEITDGFTLEAARQYKGASMVPAGQAHLLVEIDGQEKAVEEDLAALTQLVRGLGPVQLDIASTEEACESIWALRRAFSYSLRATGLIKLNEDIVVPRSRLVDLVQFCEWLQKESGFPIACFGHAGDGNIHVNIMVAEMDSPEAKVAAEDALDRLFAKVLGWGGVISGEHGIGIAKKRWFSQAASPVSLRVHEALKQALDPQGILNPGKFLDPVSNETRA